MNELDINPSNIVLLSREGEELIKSLQKTPLETLNFSRFAKTIRHSIPNIDLEEIAQTLEQESLRLPDEEIENVAHLRNIALDLKASKQLITLIINKIVRKG